MDAIFFKVAGVISAASVCAGAVGAGLTQVPGSDAVPLAAIQVSLVQSVAWLHRVKINDAAAQAFLANFTAQITGRYVSQTFVAWAPGYGNAINATTAASLTAAIGWAVHKFYSKGGD